MLREIIVRSPCKVILTGEHAVVHGCPALAVSIEPFNTVTLIEKPGDQPSITIAAKGRHVELSERGEVTAGGIDWPVYCELVRHLIEQKAFTLKERIEINIDSNVPKGVGASSSIAAGIALALYKHRGNQPSKEQLFEAAQFVDKIAHGGNPSGIDAMTVIAGPTRLTRVVQKGEVKWNFEHQKLDLPRETELLVIDTFTGGARATTGEMIKRFSTTLGLVKGSGEIKPMNEFTSADREKLKPFEEVYDRIVKQLAPDGDAKELGKAMGYNHSLLAKAGVSSAGIEKALAIARESGALGGKITGAGGEGGAVIALVNKTKAQKIMNALQKAGFSAFEAKRTRGLME